MSLVDVDTWITEYEACERLSHQILSQIAQRDKESKLSENYSKISANVRIGLNQFSIELSQLKNKLDASSKTPQLTFEEVERRHRELENLQSKFHQLQNKFKSVNTSERDALMKSPASQLWEDENDDPVVNPQECSVEHLRRQQIQILEDQNRGLEALSQTIARQKNIASSVGVEVEQQNSIIDNIAENIDGVEARVTSETRHIGIVNKQDKIWGYWVVIIILFIAICVVALI